MMFTCLCRYHTRMVTFWLSRQYVFCPVNTMGRIFDAVTEFPVILKPNARHLWSESDDIKEEKRVLIKQQEFENKGLRNRQTFLAIVQAFKEGNKQRLGQVEFVKAALRSMTDYGVELDLECYRSLLDTFPRGLISKTNYFEANTMKYPRHQFCAISLFTQMEENGVFPDRNMQRLLITIFGPYSHASRKFGRMLYWMPKFKNLSPFPLPDPLPKDIFDLAMLAMKRISSIDLQTKIDVFETEKLEEALDTTWIISSQSPKQKEMLDSHDKEKPLYVEGPFVVWLKRVSISYFMLRADAKVFPEVDIDDDDVSNLVENVLNPLKRKAIVVKPSVHEQDDGVIMALCATGTSSRDSVLSWIRFLRQENPVLDTLSVLFTLKAPSKELALNDKRSENLVEEVAQMSEPS